MRVHSLSSGNLEFWVWQAASSMETGLQGIKGREGRAFVLTYCLRLKFLLSHVDWLLWLILILFSQAGWKPLQGKYCSEGFRLCDPWQGYKAASFRLWGCGNYDLGGESDLSNPDDRILENNQPSVFLLFLVPITRNHFTALLSALLRW